MKPIRPLLLLAVLALPALAGCIATGRPQGVSAVDQAAFWDRLQALCGSAYAGELAEGNAADSALFGGQRLVMHVRRCSEREIRIPFSVGADRSRTWVVTRTDAGLRLKHDHRHEDGTPDRVTDYGGDTRGQGGAERQDFFADQHTAQLVPGAADNVWTIEVVPGRSFTYGLTRESTGRRVRIRFDLARPLPPPVEG